MKTNILLTLFTILICHTVVAQKLTKKEKKALKKELRTFKSNPEKFKSLKENLKDRNTVIDQQKNQLEEIEVQKNVLKSKLSIARDSIGFYKSELVESNNNPSIGNCRDDQGMKYRVQIGLYKELDLSNFLESFKVLSFEQVGELFRYTIGNFETEEEAEEFKLAIRSMGIRDAFVSFYNHGDRIPKP